MFNASKIHGFDLILMDIRMPEMNGLEAAQLIRSEAREDAKTIPIIAMSANAYAEDIQKSLQVGMNEHLAKPVSQELLTKMLEKYLTNKTKELL